MRLWTPRGVPPARLKIPHQRITGEPANNYRPGRTTTPPYGLCNGGRGAGGAPACSSSGAGESSRPVRTPDIKGAVGVSRPRRVAGAARIRGMKIMLGELLSGPDRTVG